MRIRIHGDGTHNTQRDNQMNITIYRLNRPRGQFSEITIVMKKEGNSPTLRTFKYVTASDITLLLSRDGKTFQRANNFGVKNLA